MIWLESSLSLLLERFGETDLVIGFLIRGLIVLALCATTLILFRKSASTWRHEIAMSGMLLAASLPIVVALGTGGALFVTLPALNRSMWSTPYEPTESVSPRSGSEANRVAAVDRMADDSARLESRVWHPELIPLVWLVGVGAISLLWAGQRLAASVQLRPWRPVPQAWRDLMLAIGGSRAQADRLSVSAGAPVPLIWGLLMPRIVLPLEAADWDEERLEIAMRHELAHVRRRDSLTRFAANLATIIHWPNPFAWLTRKRLELERELACDRDVIAGGIAPSTYARELLEMVTILRDVNVNHRRIAMAERSNIKQRIKEALGAPESPPPRLRLTRVLLVFVVGVLTVAVSSLHAAPDSGGSTPGLVASQRLEAMGGSDLDRLAAALRSGDLETWRANAPLSVPRRAVAPLLDALTDPNPDVREVAAWALGETRSRRARRALRNVLLDPDPRVRAAAAHSLGDVGGSSDVPDLIRALDDPDHEVRLRAAHALGDQRDPRALDALVSHLMDEQASVAEKADWALREILEPLDTYGLVLALNHPEARVRFHATHFLGDKADRDTVAPLISVLGDPDPPTRVEAAWALGEIADSGAVHALTTISTSHDEPSDLREMAIRGLGEIRDQHSGSVLAALTTDPDWRIRGQAADSLGALRNEDFRALLERLSVQDPNAEVREVAAKAARRSR